MIVVAGTLNVDPADRDAFLTAAKAAMAGTIEEDGCHAYNFSPDINDPGVVHFFEVWEAEDNIGPHLETEHIKTFGQALNMVTGQSIMGYKVVGAKSLTLPLP